MSVRMNAVRRAEMASVYDGADQYLERSWSKNVLDVNEN